jgi:hypothetical protein
MKQPRSTRLTRRTFLAAALPWLAACTTPLPLGPLPRSDKTAALRLQDSAEAHGLAAYRGLHDISVSYEGQWRPFIGRIQPEIVDPAFRGGSQERLLPRDALVAQSHTGPAGHKQVVWRRAGGPVARPGSIAVWRNDVRAGDAPTLEAAALVAEAYAMFLLGPLWLVDRGLVVRLDGRERVDGRDCDVVEVWLEPGLGEVLLDRVALCIDRTDDLVRRFRFTLEGTANTRGAVAEVDTFDHLSRFGLRWPTRFHERVVHPIHIPAHDWHLAGLDVDRGFRARDIDGPTFTGVALRPAASL